MTEDIKGIVAPFIKKAVEEIHSDTPVTRASVGNSIALHRLFAKLEESGHVVRDRHLVKTFGDILRQVSPDAEASDTTASAPTVSSAGPQRGQVGIDIEEVAALPAATDFRDHPFYSQNFTPEEIAHCILQAEPIESFAGLFAAKEAIVKADGRLNGVTFDKIAIRHDLLGKPSYEGFQISISHTDTTAVAVAVCIGDGMVQEATPGAAWEAGMKNMERRMRTFRSMAILSLIIALACLVMLLRS